MNTSPTDFPTSPPARLRPGSHDSALPDPPPYDTAQELPSTEASDSTSHPTSPQGGPWVPPVNRPPSPPRGSGPYYAAAPVPPGVMYPRPPNKRVVDPFAEGPHYGPVLEPFLAKILGAVVELNPLLTPPLDTPDDYIRWDMLFHTDKCYRTTEFTPSWVTGRNAPATHPRLMHVQIISRAFPWMIHVHAEKPELGVTCGEVLDAISASMYENVAKKEYENLDPGKKRQVSDSYEFNRSTELNAPSGRIGEGLKRLDRLGSESRFGGLVANDVFVKEHCGDVLPCTFELKCLSNGLIKRAVIRQDHWEKYVRRKGLQV